MNSQLEAPFAQSIDLQNKTNKVLTGDYDVNVQDEEYISPPTSGMNTSKEELDSFLELSTDIVQ